MRKAKKNCFPTILARWQEQENYRSSLKDHDIGEQEVMIFCDRLAMERHNYTATEAERMRYFQIWVLTLNAEGKQPPRQLRPDYEEAKTRMSTTTRRIFWQQKGSSLHPSTQVNKDVKTRINNFKDLKNTTALLIERQDGGGIRSSRGDLPHASSSSSTSWQNSSRQDWNSWWWHSSKSDDEQ